MLDGYDLASTEILNMDEMIHADIDSRNHHPELPCRTPNLDIITLSDSSLLPSTTRLFLLPLAFLLQHLVEILLCLLLRICLFLVAFTV